MQYKRIVSLLLIISSPFIISLTFDRPKKPHVLPAMSGAGSAEANYKSSPAIPHDDLNEGLGNITANMPEGEPLIRSGDLNANEANDNPIQTDDREEVIIKSSPVIASILHDTKLYNTIKDSVIGDIQKGQKVEILQDRSWTWYEIAFEDTKGWVQAEALDIPPDPPTNPKRCSKKQLEEFINEKHFESDTPYLIWVSIDRQLVQIFKGSMDNWNLHRTMLCSTGTNDSPTARGLFMVSDRDTWMYTPRLGSGAKNWVRFNNTYLFHSVAYAKDGQTVVDDTLGVRSSAGCVRLSLDDSQWIYDHIERGTSVWVD